MSVNRCLNCDKFLLEEGFVGWCSMDCYQESQNKALDALSGEETESSSGRGMVDGKIA